MEVSLLLAEKITSMFLMCIFGYVVVKCKLLKPMDSKILSIVLVYVCTPCVNIYSYQIDYTPKKLEGLIFALLVVAAVHVFIICLTKVIQKLCHLNEVERTSIIYSNCGNLVIPLVISTLGTEWLFYTSAYMFIQTLMIWSHGVLIMKKDSSGNPKKESIAEQLKAYGKVILNPNIIAILIGFSLFLLKIRLPAVANDCFSGFSGMLGPIAMLVTGMLIGDADLKAIVTKKRVWLVCFLRLIVIPLMVLALIKITGIVALHPDGKKILMVVMLGVSASVANTVTQQAQLYEKDAVYAGSINILSLICCIVTMPVMILLLETWI